jgi:hypothetical protein
LKTIICPQGTNIENIYLQDKILIFGGKQLSIGYFSLSYMDKIFLHGKKIILERKYFLPEKTIFLGEIYCLSLEEIIFSRRDNFLPIWTKKTSEKKNCN